jgi:hypothetical protein
MEQPECRVPMFRQLTNQVCGEILAAAGSIKVSVNKEINS